MSSVPKEQCNCTWGRCPVCSGAGCANDALFMESPTVPGRWAACGDGVLGDGVHLCESCAMAVAKLLFDRLGETMTAISPFIPKEFESMERVICATVTKAINCATNPKKFEGWVHMHRDLAACMGLILLARKVPQSIQKSTGKFIDDLISLFGKSAGFEADELQKLFDKEPS